MLSSHGLRRGNCKQINTGQTAFMQPEHILAAVALDPDVLMTLLSRQVDDSMLREIAEADYGLDCDEHLEALKRLRDRLEVQVPLNGIPREVLELIRWSEPDDPKWRPGRHGKRGHIMRAFACAALLRAAAEAGNSGYFEGENQTLAQLMASVLVLDRDVQVAAVRFLAWRVSSVDGEDRPFFAFAILVLAAVLNGELFPQESLTLLADWVVAEEKRERETLQARYRSPSPQWLLGLTSYDMRHRVWRSLADRLVVEANKCANKQVRDRLQLLGLRISPG